MKYLILGAGPAGLTFASLLKRAGISSFVILEKESMAGGLCRSETVDGMPLDIGGGHFLDTKNERVCNFLFEFMPKEEWNIFSRNSLIRIHDQYIAHPIEANIWQLPDMVQKDYLKSISQAGCNVGEAKPEKFIDWIFWKLGDRIAEDYMIPYNRKMFMDELDNLGTYWLEKLPNVSYEDTLRSCKEHKSYGKEPGHTRFYYPKRTGYGEVWRRMSETIKDNIVYEKIVKSIDLDQGKVQTSDGEEYSADCIITTIPWRSYEEIKGIPDNKVKLIKQLKSSSIEIRYFSEVIDLTAQWIYYPDMNLPYHRCLLRKNFMESGKGYWTETRVERSNMFYEESNFRYVNEYAYPLNTVDKPQIMNELIQYMESKNVYPIGRWGEHMHLNSDVVVDKAMKMFERLENH